MPNLYSASDLTGSSIPSRSFTCPIYTQGFTITNFSNVPMLLQTDNLEDMGIVLPYFSRTYAAKKGDLITLTPQALLNAQVLPNMFVGYDISQATVTPAIVPLAQVSGYQMNVTGNVMVDGTPEFNIANTPAVTISGTPTVNVGGAITVGNTALNVQNTDGGSLSVAGTVSIGNSPSVNIANTVDANITSGSVNATIQNASISAQVINAMNNPVNIQPPMQTMTNIGIQISSSGTATYPIVSSGGRLQHIQITMTLSSNFSCYAGLTIQIMNNGNVLDTLPIQSYTTPRILDYANGIANNGISIAYNGTINAGFISLSGYCLTS